MDIWHLCTIYCNLLSPSSSLLWLLWHQQTPVGYCPTRGPIPGYIATSRCPSCSTDTSRFPSGYADTSRALSCYTDTSGAPSCYTDTSRVPSGYTDTNGVPSGYADTSRFPPVEMIVRTPLTPWRDPHRREARSGSVRKPSPSTWPGSRKFLL